MKILYSEGEDLAVLGLVVYTPWLLLGLVPLLWADGTGADVMRRLAAPMIGGLLVSFAMELLVYPVVFRAVRRWQWRERWAGAGR